MPDSRTLPPAVEVRAAVAHRFVVATRAYAPGDPILSIDGDLVQRPGRYTLQIDEGLHVEAPEHTERYPWCFLNHACAPSAVLRGRQLVALRPIAVGEEVTIDYDATEYEMAEPFRCHCGACDGREIGGFARLSAEERARRAPLLAPHLKRRLCPR